MKTSRTAQRDNDNGASGGDDAHDETLMLRLASRESASVEDEKREISGRPDHVGGVLGMRDPADPG